MRSSLEAVLDPTTYLRAVADLCSARLLVPLVASGEAGGDHAHAELAAVSLRGADGRLGLLAFTGIDSLVAWNAQARPVPATLDDAAASVAEAGADVLLIDVAGPTPLEITGQLVDHLARGERLVELSPGDFGWLQPPAGRSSTEVEDL